MEACCVVDAEESALGKMIAESFMDSFTEHVCDDSVISLLITENGNAAGFVTGDIDREMNIVTVEIFVNRRYRGKGYAKCLLSALCAALPEVVYCYSCKKENVASMNTAKSCGFVCKGAYLLVDSN